jgi:hypothetical protein
MTLCGSLFAPVDPKKIPVKDEPAFFGNNLTFDEIRKHLAEKGYANVASSRFLARKRSTPPETTKYFDSLPVDRVFTKDSPKRSGIILPFTNSNHETVAYQVIFDKYVNSISGTSCEESPNATYVGSAREIYTDRKSLYGAYCLLGKAYNPEEKEIWVVEDYAAGASLLEMNPAACVVMCGLSSNLSACVETLFKQYARNEFEGLEQIVIFANNDLSAYYGMLNSAKADQAVNAGIFAAVETYEVYRNNALGVGIAVCAIPDALALEHTAKDFDCLRQCLALENKTLSTSWRDYEADILAYLEDTNSFCAPEKAAIFKTKVEVKTKESSLSRRDYLIKLEKKLSEVVTRVSTVHKVDEARLSDTVGDMLSESKGMVYVQSAMGTGKTYQLKRMIRKVCSRGENVLYLIPSLSLHKQLIKDFREMGLNVVDYQDLATEKKEGGNFHKPHVAVCVINSTAKFREGNYSTIVMDESDQCLHNVIRLLESPFDFTKGFSSMLNKADRVIACYAQLSTLSTDYLNSLRKEKGILILNSFKPAEHKTVHMMPTVVSTYKVIRDLLRKEKKLLIVSNSSQETKRIKHLIDETLIRKLRTTMWLSQALN